MRGHAQPCCAPVASASPPFASPRLKVRCRCVLLHTRRVRSICLQQSVGACASKRCLLGLALHVSHALKPLCLSTQSLLGVALNHPSHVRKSSRARPGTHVRHAPTPLLQVRARFVERFSMGAPFAGGEVVGPAIGDLHEKVSWVEKFVAQGACVCACVHACVRVCVCVCVRVRACVRACVHACVRGIWTFPRVCANLCVMCTRVLRMCSSWARARACPQIRFYKCMRVRFLRCARLSGRVLHARACLRATTQSVCACSEPCSAHMHGRLPASNTHRGHTPCHTKQRRRRRCRRAHGGGG